MKRMEWPEQDGINKQCNEPIEPEMVTLRSKRDHTQLAIGVFLGWITMFMFMIYTVYGWICN